MGAECPNGHGFQPVVQNIGVPGEEIVKSSDVVAHKLKCGCVVGGPDYEAFQRQVLEIRNAEKLSIKAEQEKARKAIGAALVAYHNKESE